MPAKKKSTTIEETATDNKGNGNNNNKTKAKTQSASYSVKVEKALTTKKEELPKPTTITRLELAAEVAKAVGHYMEITGRDAEAIVAEIINSMIDSLKDGNEIEIRGFGSFRLRTRNPRRGRNPKTGESVDVPAKRIAYFKIGKDLKATLLENK